jgi:hypothetical protein
MLAGPPPGLPRRSAPARHSGPAPGAPPPPRTPGPPTGPVATAVLPAGSSDTDHSAARSRRSGAPRMAAAAPPPAGPRGCASYSERTGARPSGTRSLARPAAGVPPPDAARPGPDGSRRVREMAGHSAGNTLAPRPRFHPLARLAEGYGRPRGVRVGRRGSGRSASAGASGGRAVGPTRGDARSWMSAGPAGLPTRGCALAGRHSGRAGRRSPAGASPTAPRAMLRQVPAALPIAPAPGAEASRSCCGCSASGLVGQARRGAS